MSYMFDPRRADPAGELMVADSNKLENSILDLEHAISTYLSTVEGATVDNYTVAQKQWANGFDELKLALANAETAFSEVGQNYVVNDLKGAEKFAANFH